MAVKDNLHKLELRINELEQREAFHEVTIETLNTCLIEQQKEIDLLKHQLQKIVLKIDKHSDELELSTLNERPPHY